MRRLDDLDARSTATGGQWPRLRRRLQRPSGQPQRMPAAIKAILSDPRQNAPCPSVRVLLCGRREARDFERAPGCSTEGATDMPRILMISFMLATSIVVLTPHANAQSPDPAMLAPAAGQAGLAPSQNAALRPTYTSPRSGGDTRMQSRFGRYLSHPRVHGLS
jgi:hypothetical protein